MKKALSLTLAAAMLLTTLAGCGKKEEPKPAKSADKPAASSSEKAPEPAKPAEPKVLRISYTTDITTLDSSLSYSEKTNEVLANCAATLFKHDVDGNLTNEVVKDYNISEDGLTYTFNLRNDFKWTNGDPLTAHDFVYALRRIADPDTGSSYADTVINAHLKNGEEVVNGEKPVTELGAAAPDDYTLVLTLSHPCPYLLTFLGAFIPINQKFCEAQGDKFGTAIEYQIWCGAYKLTDWQTEYEAILEKNPDYPMADDIKIDTISIKVIKDVNTAVNLFETNELDYTELTGEQAIQYKDDPRAVIKPCLMINVLTLCQKRNPILANVNARKAISHVLDKQFVVDEIQSNGATIADYLIPYGLAVDENGKDFRDTTNIPPAYDIELAKEYWEKAKDELKLDSYEIKLLTGDSAKSKRVAEFFQSQLEKNLDGVTVTFEYATSKNGIQKELDGDFDCTFSTWNADFLDLSTYTSMYVTGAYINTGRFHNEEYDELCRKANDEDVFDREARWADLRRAEEILVVDEAGIVPIYQNAKMYLVSERLQGFHNAFITPNHFFGIMDIVDG